MTRPKIYLPIAEALTPKDGEVVTNRWWVTKDDGLLFIQFPGRPPYHAAQCNRHHEIAESIREKLYPDHWLVHLDTVYVGRLYQSGEPN